MGSYRNMMEVMVEEELEHQSKSLGCCMCPQCQSDIIAYALNQLPPRYVATWDGSLISKADSLRIQHLTDVRTAVVQAAQIVMEHPRHTIQNS